MSRNSPRSLCALFAVCTTVACTRAPTARVVAPARPTAGSEVVVHCDGSECRIDVGGHTALAFVHYGEVATAVTPLSGLSTAPQDTFLVAVHEGDGCPVMYRILCVEPTGTRLSSVFGNCEEPNAIPRGPPPVFLFPAHHYEVPEVVDRPAQRARFDPETCEVSRDDAT